MRLIDSYAKDITLLEFAAAINAALTFSAALAEVREDHELAETILDLSMMHEKIGRKFIQPGGQSFWKEIESREKILFDHLQQAVDTSNADVDVKANPVDELTNRLALMEGLQGMLQMVEGARSDIMSNMRKHKESDNEGATSDGDTKAE